ncbi:MAG: hypothetical protein ACKN9F_08380 [Methylomonas sp.]
MPKFVHTSIVILITITVPKAFAVDNCAFYGHGSVVSVVGTGICSSIDAVSQCSDGSYYYTGTANGVTDSYDAATTALGCGSSNASSTQSSVVGRIASSSASSKTSNANHNSTSGIANGLSGSLNLAAPAMTQTQTGQNSTDKPRAEKTVPQTTIVPESQAGQYVTDNYPQTPAQPIKPKSIKPPAVVEPLIPVELLEPIKSATIPTPTNQKTLEIANPTINTISNYPVLLMAIVLSCLCLVGIVYFGIKRFSPEKN